MVSLGSLVVVVLLILFWLLFWTTPDPIPNKSSKDPKGKDQKEGLYDLKIGSWQNRVDQDLEATRKQIAEMDLKQQEIRDQFKGIGDSLSELSLQMKEERDRDVRRLKTPSTDYGAEICGQWNYRHALWGDEVVNH